MNQFLWKKKNGNELEQYELHRLLRIHAYLQDEREREREKKREGLIRESLRFLRTNLYN